MRVTQTSNQMQFLSALTSLESNIAQTQNQVSSGRAFSTPSQNPGAAGTVDQYQQVLAQSKQYGSNANSAASSLNTEGSALTQLTNQLQSLRTLALEADSGTASGGNLNAIAAQVQQIQQSLLGIANTQDGTGQYIFGGYTSQAQPFALTASGASYAGDQGQRLVQIAAGQTVAAGDNGNTVFNQIKTGNGTFSVNAGPNASSNGPNTGSGLIGASTVLNAASYGGGSYSIQFTSPTAYQVFDSTQTPVAGGTYVPGQAIAFAGIQLTVSGQPDLGDTFNVAPSTQQSIFTTTQNLIASLQAGNGGTNGPTQLSNAIAGALGNIDQALAQTSSIQSSVGGRQNAITTQLSIATSQQTQLTVSISALQNVDYAAAITSLDSQNVTLSAAMQAYTLTEGLTLFKYLS